MYLLPSLGTRRKGKKKKKKRKDERLFSHLFSFFSLSKSDFLPSLNHTYTHTLISDGNTQKEIGWRMKKLFCR
jgi:hypothetical protein